MLVKGGAGAKRALGWALLAAIPFVFKVAPLPDAVRLQAFAQGGFAMLVGIGLMHAGMAGWLILGLGTLLGSPLSAPRWAHRQEWAFLAKTVPTLAVTESVVLPPGVPKAAAFVGVMNTLGPAPWVGLGSGTLVYRPLGAPPVGGTALVEAELDAKLNVDATGQAPPFLVGLYRSDPATSEADGALDVLDVPESGDGDSGISEGGWSPLAQ